MNNIINIQYRNAIYFGALDYYQRNGYGMVVKDNSTFILGHWKQNQLDGPYIFLTDNLVSFGQYSDGKLRGYNVIISNEEPYCRIYGMFRDGRLYGSSIIIQNNQIIMGRFINGQLKDVIEKYMFIDNQLEKMLIDVFPNHLHTIQDYLTFLIDEAHKQTNNIGQYNRYQPIKKVAKYGNKIFGYLDDQQHFGNAYCIQKIYGVMIGDNKVLSIGYHKEQGHLEGLGRLYNSEMIHDGMFIDGHLKGIGIIYNIKKNNYSLGQHDGRSILEKGFGFPHRQIQQIRKQFHLRSINFYNDIFMIELQPTLQQAISATFECSQQITIFKSLNNGQYHFGKQNQLQSNKHPLQQKVSRIEYQQQSIIECSPQFQNININWNKPKNQRVIKYFSTQENQQYSSKTESKTNKQKKQGQDFKNQQIAIKLRSNDYSNRKQNQPAKRKFKQNKKSVLSKEQKNTRLLIKKLEQEQKSKSKRLDLDRIYRQANLYQKKA